MKWNLISLLVFLFVSFNVSAITEEVFFGYCGDIGIDNTGF